MNSWEDILNQFVEGSVLRADVEALRWKIRLPENARTEIDRELKLTDDLASASELAAPSEGAAERMIAALRRAPAVAMPAHWRMTVSGPQAVTPVAPTEDERASEPTDLEKELFSLGRSIPIRQGAADRLITRLRREGAGSADTSEGDGPIVLFPPEAKLNPDALAASKETEEEEKE